MLEIRRTTSKEELFVNFDHLEDYSFALGIVEDKPVFISDTLYLLYKGAYTIDKSWSIQNIEDWLKINNSKLSWNNKDVFDDIRQAQLDGKRIAFQDSAGDWVDMKTYSNYHQQSDVHNFRYVRARYKICEEDLSMIRCIQIFGENVKVEFIKCGLKKKT